MIDLTDIKQVMVKDWCNIDNLTQDESWQDIYDHIKKEIKPDEKVMLDFKGINVNEPWTLDTFCKILKMDNVYFRFTSSNKARLTDLSKRIKMKCVLEGLFVDRIEEIYIEPPKTKTKEEIKTEKGGEELIKEFVLSEDTAELLIYKYIDQIGSIDTVSQLRYAIRKIHEENEIDNFIIRTKRMFIQDNIIELLAKTVIEFDMEGIEISVDTEIDSTYKKLGLFIYTASNESYTMDKKIKAYSDIPLNMAGMLVKYKHSRAIDEFGRTGKGEVASNRISVYRGLCVKNGFNDISLIKKVHTIENGMVQVDIAEVTKKGTEKLATKWVDFDRLFVCIDSYNDNLFITHAEYASYHDGEVVNDKGEPVTFLPYLRIVDTINNIGLGNKFLGKKYHFMRPTQRFANQSKKIITGIDDNGSCIRKVVTIPERIKIVMDDWGEHVNFELERDIHDAMKFHVDDNEEKDGADVEADETVGVV